MRGLHRRPRPQARQRGIAIIIVLWGLALVTVLALTVTSEGRSNLLVTRNLIQVSKARALAEAGVHHALYEMLARGDSGRWAPTGEIYRYPLGDGGYQVRVLDETGRIDLNTLRPELLERVLEQIAPEADSGSLAAAFMDFRDRDELPTAAGLEDGDYAARGYAWDAKDRNFEHVSELAQVPGFTPEIVDALTRFVTVYSRQRSVRPEAALPETLALIEGDFEQAPAGADDEAEDTTMLRGFDRSRIYVIQSVGRFRETRYGIAAHVVLTGGADAFQFVSWDESPELAAAFDRR